LLLENSLGCDSLVVTSTIEASSSETNVFVNTCIPDLANDTIFLKGQICDSVVITVYIYEPIPPSIISINTCDENDLMSDTLILITERGCDSLVITEKEYTPVEILQLTQSTCDESLLGVFVDTLSSQFGCDSLIQTTYIPDSFQAEYDLIIEPSSCFEFTDGSVDILSTDEISVRWLFDGSDSFSRDDLLAGDYMVQLLQGACDTIIIVTVPEGIGMQVDLEVTYLPCSAFGGNIAAIPSSGVAPYTYLWADGAEDSLRVDLTNGTYTVTVTDALSCSTFISTEIINVTGLDFETDIEHVSCFGYEDGSIMITLLSGTAPFTEQWSDGGETLFRDSLPAGDYSVTISDVNNCNITLNRAVQEPDILAITLDVTKDEEIVVTVSGGTQPYIYLWNDGTTSDRIEMPVSGVEYEVTVTDANGCIAVDGMLYQTEAVQIINAEHVVVYPNPTSEKIYLSTHDELHIQEIILYDIHGRKVLAQTNQNQTVFSNLDLSDFIPGAYILEVQFADGIFRDKILVIR